MIPLVQAKVVIADQGPNEAAPSPAVGGETTQGIKVLGQIFDRCETDKGSTHDAHRYDNLYEILFGPLRQRPVRLLELGAGTGASIEAWLNYFDDVTVHAVDRDLSRCRSDLGKPVKLYEGRSEDPTLVSEGDFDIIIDDGNHDRANQIDNIRIYWPKLKNAGFYVVEDLLVGIDGTARLPWGGEASPSSNPLMPPYVGHGNLPDRDYLPRYPQDLYLLSRRGLAADVCEILDANNHYFAITNISVSGGLHMLLVIQKAVGEATPRARLDHAQLGNSRRPRAFGRRGTLKQIAFRNLSRVPFLLRLWRRLKPDGGSRPLS
jgi:hypothetical protein